MAALKEAALVIDLVFMLFSKEQLEIQASGTRNPARRGASPTC